MQARLHPYGALGLILVICFVCSMHSAAHAAEVRSIRNWVVGDGKTDDARGVARAFAECKNNAFTLRVDCHVFIHIGMDIARPIFIDNGTHVEFTKDGLFITDDVLLPAFVLANTTDVSLVDWRVEYVGGLPTNRDVGGYYDNGRFVPANGSTQPASVFNDRILTPWLRRERRITFDHTNCPWHGPSSMSAMFYFIGNTKDVRIDGMKLFVPESAGADKFIPVAFALNVGYNSDQTAVRSPDGNLLNTPGVSAPSHIDFSNITLDGYYMGWSGIMQYITFKNLVAIRYGDLQDANGGNIGGQEKWFAPPHLFYIQYQDNRHAEDSRFSSRNLLISHVLDLGKRVGVARDRPGDKLSGYANSLKIGAVDSTVEDYESRRPDGLADILSSENLTFNRVVGIYDSSFIHELYPGIRFPAGPYHRVTFNDLTLTDLSPHSYRDSRLTPIGGNRNPDNTEIHFNRVIVHLQGRSSADALKPIYDGSNHHVDIQFDIRHE